MIDRNRAASLTQHRSVLGSTRDVSVGAYARRQQRRRVAIAFVGLVLIGGSAWLLKLMWPTVGGDRGNRHPVLVRCVTCNHQEVVQQRAGDAPFPLTCPACKERSCYQVWQCRNCNLQFLPVGSAATLRCPRCGSERVGAAEALESNPGGP